MNRPLKPWKNVGGLAYVAFHIETGEVVSQRHENTSATGADGDIDFGIVHLLEFRFERIRRCPTRFQPVPVL